MLVVTEGQMKRFEATISKLKKDIEGLNEAVNNLGYMLNIIHEIKEEKIIMSVDPRRLYIEESKLLQAITELSTVTEEAFCIEKGTLWNGIRKRPYPEAKYCVIHALLIHFSIHVSHTDLGRLLNYGDHSTINYALKHFDELSYDRQYVSKYNYIIDTSEAQIKQILND